MIKLEHINKSFGKLQVFNDFGLEFPAGEITAILGPSGCGKTTLLNILAGLIQVDQGKVETAGDVSYLFQEPRLLPWLTIRQNIALVLQDKMPARDVQKSVTANLTATGLIDYAHYYPWQLSGGMRQRTAMARAFAFDAPLLLMDEPFKSLDLKTRTELLANFIHLWTKAPRTVITVTHDIREAVMIADLIVVMNGRPVRVDFKRKVGLSQSERIQSDKLMALEQELYEQLLQ
jgi:ABC-type nitrate/sulfonate/bicarbonate transport system, ATPase component